MEDLLRKEDLVLEELLAIDNVHNKIKNQLHVFVEHCLKNENFTNRFIDIGLKCPMHLSSNPDMRKRTFIASDILTSDHDAVADLFVRSSGLEEVASSDEEGEIYEEIITEDSPSIQVKSRRKSSLQSAEGNRYKYLIKILEYLGGKEIDENCVNYIAKTLGNLIRKKTVEFYQFFANNDVETDRIIKHSYFPSVSQFLAKLISEDEQSKPYRSFKEGLVRKMIAKIHEDINTTNPQQILDFIDDLFQSNKYSDSEGRSELQEMSDCFVREEEFAFFTETLFRELEGFEERKASCSIFNCLAYLTTYMKRVNIDEEYDPYSYDADKSKEPTLKF